MKFTIDQLQEKFIPALRIMLGSVAVLYIVIFIGLACLRMAYPYELDWLEGSFADHVKRTLEGKSLYVEPSMDFTPYFYTPLYFYISALFAKVMGLSFLPLRLVTFISSLGCFALIFQLVKRETRSLFFGLLAAGLYAATFKINGGWFDIARLDSLFMLFVLGSIYVLRFAVGTRGLILSACLMFFAFFTKQSILLVGVALSVYTFWSYKDVQRFIFPGVFLGLVLLVSTTMTLLTDGWFYYYVFDLPTQHRLMKTMIIDFWKLEILAPLGIAFGIAVSYLVTRIWADKRDLLFYGLVFVSMVASSWMSRLHSGSWLNVLLPAYAVIAILFSLGIYTLFSDNDGISASTPNVGIFVLVLCLIQFSLLIYNPAFYLPAERDALAGDRFIEMLREVDGEIFMSYPGFLPVMAGKKYASDGGAMGDIFRGTDDALKRKLKDRIVKAIRSRRFSAIVISRPWFGFFINSPEFVAEVEKHYEYTEIFENNWVFSHANGGSVRPQRLYKLQD